MSGAVLLLLLLVGPTRAQEGAQEAAEAPSAAEAFTRARAAERAGQPEQEVAACEEVLAAGGGGRPQQACQERLGVLSALEDPGGGWAGLRALEAARRSPISERGLALRALAVDPAVAPAVRAQAAATQALAALATGDAAAALAWTDPWWPGQTLPTSVRVVVGRARAQALVAQGRSAEAAAVEGALGLPGRGGVEDLERQARRERLARGAAVLLGAWALVATPLAARGWMMRPRPRPVGLVALVGVGLASLLLASGWEAAVAGPFALLILALGVSHLVAAGAARSLAERPRARALLGLGSGLAALAVGVLGLHLGGLWGWVGG